MSDDIKSHTYLNEQKGAKRTRLAFKFGSRTQTFYSIKKLI